MKKIAILAALLMLCGCSTFKPIQESSYASFLDFRPYTSEGFFLSPNPYTGEHETLGELYLEIQPAQVEITEHEMSSHDLPMWYGTQAYGFKRINHAVLLQQAVEHAKAKNANALVNLKITKHTQANRVYYSVSGLCIRI